MATIFLSKSKKQDLPKRKESDFYPTPIEICRKGLEKLPKDFYPFEVLDPGSGDGVWYKAFRGIYGAEPFVTGVEIRNVELDFYDNYFSNTDYLKLKLKPESKDLIMGNPPYALAKEFILKGLSELNTGGYLIFLLKLAILESKDRFRNLYSVFPPKEVCVLTKRPSFYGTDRKTGADAYCFVIWEKDYKGDTKLTWAEWDYDKD